MKIGRRNCTNTNGQPFTKQTKNVQNI